MDHYLKLLFEQFKQSEGLKGTKDEPKIHMIDLIEWIRERERIGLDYLDLLHELDIPFEYSDCAEVGKSYLDSAVKEFGTTIITPYKSNFPQERIIEGEFEIFGAKPTIILPNNERRIISTDAISTFITHNPYSEESIATWHNLHNSRNGNIAVTVFGKTYDKDVENKISMLRKFRERLQEPRQDIYEKVGDNYFYVVRSKPKVKTLYKVKEK